MKQALSFVLLCAASVTAHSQAVAISQSTDTRKTSYEMQERCARNAREWYKANWDNRHTPDVYVATNYTNHYSAKLGGCFVAVDSDMYGKKSGKPYSEHYTLLVNALENRDIGSALWNNQGEFTHCQVNDVACASLDQWKALLKPYMED